MFNIATHGRILFFINFTFVKFNAIKDVYKAIPPREFLGGDDDDYPSGPMCNTLKPLSSHRCIANTFRYCLCTQCTAQKTRRRR